MAQTLNSLFPFSTLAIKGATVYPITVEFEAPIIAGKYVFSEATTPAKKFDCKLMQDQAGVIAGVMISANCTPEDFAQNSETLKLQILHGGNNTPANMNPFPFSTFQDGENFQEIMRITSATKLNEEEFKLAVTGNVRQIANMFENVLRLKVSFNFIRVPEKFFF